jgi:hypothetical protein
MQPALAFIEFISQPVALPAPIEMSRDPLRHIWREISLDI